MQAWTDYPFVELGDVPGEEAEVRECEVLSYDGNKYCRIRVGGVETEVKSGYLYSEPGRLGEVPRVDVGHLSPVPFSNGDKVRCLRASPEVNLDGRRVDICCCIEDQLYTIDRCVWSSVSDQWLVSITGEYHKARDFAIVAKTASDTAQASEISMD